ncbi:MAG: hypothetical protein HYT87_09870 [Nitrospirae bacterium]|nr:hypothetical protein [Nitrospirota bacterium]
MILSEAARKAIAADSPTATRMLAARRLLPLSPPEQLYVLHVLTQADEDAVRETALETLESFPKNLVVAACEHVDDPGLIGFLAQKYRQESAVIGKLVALPAMPEDTLCFLSEYCEDPLILRIIAERHDRIRAAPKIFHSLRKNPLTPQWLLLQLEGDIPGLVAPTAPPLPEPAAPEATAPARLPSEGAPDASFFPSALIDAGTPEDQLPAIRSLLKDMEGPRRVLLAPIANRFVRYILVQDGFLDVAMGVLSNPALTVDEVVQFCQLRNVSQDILRRIGTHTDWSKDARVRNLLVKNPKTPHFLVLRFLEGIGSLLELERLAKSREVSGAVSHAAQTIVQKRAFRKNASAPPRNAGGRRSEGS